MLDRVQQDSRFALRTLRRSPAVTVVVIVTLALGIGVITAIFSVVDGILFRPLPFDEPHRLVRVWSTDLGRDDRFVDASFPDFEAFRGQADAFDSIAAFSIVSRSLRDAYGTPRNVIVGRIAGPLFSLVGVDLFVGRDFTLDELDGGASTTVLSHELWQSRYRGDRGIVGESVEIDAAPYTVIGVLPPTFAYPRDVALWRPFSREESHDDDRELFVMGRLERGVTPEQASGQVDTIAARLAAERPEINEGIGAWAQPLHEMIVGDVRASLLLLLGAVGAVLLIACANIASMLLAWGTARAHEMSIRSALGAGGRRLVTQVLTESMLLALAGGALGFFLGGWLLDLVVAVTPADTPRLAEVTLDTRVAFFVLAITALAGTLFGLPPALRAARAARHGAIRGAGPFTAGSARTGRLHQALVGTQFAISTALVIGAALLVVSFQRQAATDRGFEPLNVLAVEFEAPKDSHLDDRAFIAEVSSRVTTIAGVEAVAVGSASPMEPWGFSSRMLGVGDLPEPAAAGVGALVRAVTPGYFAAIGTPVLDGREFNAGDREGAPLVAIVNQSFATGMLPGQAATGFRLTMAALGDDDGPAGVEIVGVVADVITELGAPPRSMIFISGLQVPLGLSRMFVRTAGVPASSVVAQVRDAFWSVDAGVALDTELLDTVVTESIAAPRFNMRLVTLFSALALVLAAVGVYGVVSYSVAARTREIGVRQALGATSGSILGWVLRRCVVLIGAGMGAGVVGALALSSLLRRFLYGIEPTDPVVYAVVVALLAGVGVLACLVPARRAARVDPIVALRGD